MFEGWSEFYVLVGTAASVLIGLIFVVISLMQDKSRSNVLAGSRLYMGPIVLGVSFLIVLSAAALTPGIGRCAMAAITGAVAVWGLTRGIMSFAGIRQRSDVHWTDTWFYGVFPSLLYGALGLVALGFWWGCPQANNGLAAAITLSLLLAIRNEWDLITWIAPQRDAPGDGGFD